MKLSLGIVIVGVMLLGCGKKDAPPSPAKIDATPPVPATPNGVIGCGNFEVAIPDATMTQYLVLTVDSEKLGPRRRLDFSYPYSNERMVLEVYESPPRARDVYCTDYGTEEQRPKRYFAVEGKVEYERRGDLARVIVKDARFVDRDGHVIDVAERSCENVLVGWYPG